MNKKPNKFVGGEDEAKAIIEAMKRGMAAKKQEDSLNKDKTPESKPKAKK